MSSVVSPSRTVLAPIKVLRPTSPKAALARPTASLFRPPTTTASSPAKPAVTAVTGLRKMSSFPSGEVPTFGFKERQASNEEKQLIDDVLQLYQLKPVSSAYARYAPKAVFHDPVSIAEGLDSVKAQFNGMPKVFSQTDITGLKVLDNPEVKPPSVQFALGTNYHFKFPSTQKLVNSLITLKVDPSNNLIIHHEEQWDGEANSTGADGFFGKINEARKKFTAEAIRMASDTRPVDQQK